MLLKQKLKYSKDVRMSRFRLFSFTQGSLRSFFLLILYFCVQHTKFLRLTISAEFELLFHSFLYQQHLCYTLHICGIFFNFNIVEVKKDIRAGTF